MSVLQLLRMVWSRLVLCWASLQRHQFEGVIVRSALDTAFASWWPSDIEQRVKSLSDLAFLQREGRTQAMSTLEDLAHIGRTRVNF